MNDERILANLIKNKAERQPDLDVLTFVNVSPSGELEHEIRTYRQLWERGQQVRAALKDEGMQCGESFALVMQNHPEFVDCMVGSSLAGTVFVPIDPRTRDDKLRYMLAWADCQGIVCADYCFAAVKDVIENLPQIKWIWVLRTGEISQLRVADARVKDFEAVLPASPVAVDTVVQSPDEKMQMLFTSGTTGDPKAILAPYARFDSVASLGSAIGLQPHDRPYTGLSLTHANAQLISLGNILKMGLRGVISRRFTKTRLWDICRTYGCTVFNLLGGMTTAIYSEPAKDDDADNPVRYVLSAGMPAAIWNDFSRRFGVEIFEFYGAAEGGLTFNPPGTGPIGSIGKPPPSLRARIIDGEGRECGPGERGEIVFEALEGEPLSVEYYKNPEASREKARDGILYMGDIGHCDEQGWFYFDSRKGSEIRRNGEFIDVARIEKAIAEFNEVEDVFVYGIPASNGAPGERDVVAAVVPVEATFFEPARLMEHCRTKLRASELPSYIQIMSEIPKTASEKPQSHVCHQIFLQQKNHVYAFG